MRGRQRAGRRSAGQSADRQAEADGAGRQSGRAALPVSGDRRAVRTNTGARATADHLLELSAERGRHLHVQFVELRRQEIAIQNRITSFGGELCQ